LFRQFGLVFETQNYKAETSSNGLNFGTVNNPTSSLHLSPINSKNAHVKKDAFEALFKVLMPRRCHLTW